LPHVSSWFTSNERASGLFENLCRATARGIKIHVVPAEPEVEYSEEYYENLAPDGWVRSVPPGRACPREERENELRWYHDDFNTPTTWLSGHPNSMAVYRTFNRRAVN